MWAVSHYRREWHVGGSTAVTLALNKFMPGIGGWYLARQGYEAQQYDGEADPARPLNLDAPSPGDHGAHGDFSSRAASRSLQVWLSQHRGLLLAAGVLLTGLLVGCRSARYLCADSKMIESPF